MFLSFLQGMEAVSKCQVINRRVGTDSKTMLGRPLSLRLCLYRQLYLTNNGINKIPKCFSCPDDSKELSKKTKRSTYDSNQARTKPWPTRPPTSDNNSPITKRIRTNETPKCLAIVADCRRNQGSSQLTIWQWLTHKLTLRTTNSKQTQKRRQQDTSNYLKPQEKAGKVQTKANTANTFSATTMWVWPSL